MVTLRDGQTGVESDGPTRKPIGPPNRGVLVVDDDIELSQPKSSVSHRLRTEEWMMRLKV